MAHDSQNLVAVQLETCHAERRAVAFYAYFRQEPDEADWEDALEAADEAPAPLSLNPADQWEDREEVPNHLSQAAGMKRFYLGGAA